MGMTGQLYASAVVPLGKEQLVSNDYETRWVPEPICMLWRGQRSFTSVGNRTTTPRSSGIFMFVNTDDTMLTTVGPSFDCLRPGLLFNWSLFLKRTENQPVFRRIRKTAKRDHKLSRVCLSTGTQWTDFN